MKYTYHYYAIGRYKQDGIELPSHIDGVSVTDQPIDSSARYDEFRKALAAKNEVEPERLSICSLTLLSLHDPEHTTRPADGGPNSKTN